VTDPFVVPIFVTDHLDKAVAYWEHQGASAGGMVVRGVPGDPTRERVLSFSNRLGTPRRSVVGLDDSSSDFVYDITPKGDGLKDVRGQVIRSTTFQATPLHTDGYNAVPPPRLMILQVVIAGRGGLTTMARASDAAALISPKSLALLRDEVFPVAVGQTRLLWQAESGWNTRVNIYEINALLAKKHDVAVSNAHIGALSEYSEVLDYMESRSENRTQLQVGDIVVLDNQAVLHGRLPLEPGDSERLLHRVWCN